MRNLRKSSRALAPRSGAPAEAGRGEGGFTLIEIGVVLFIVGLVISVMFAWSVISTRIVGTGLRTAMRSSDEERLLGLLQEDLAQASRLAAADDGFTLDLPGEGQEPDKVRYRVEQGKEGNALVRAFSPGEGSSQRPVTARVASWVKTCVGGVPNARTFRVRVEWQSGKGPDLGIDVARRVER